MLDPIRYSTAWSYFTIGGKRSPGIAVMSGFKRKNVWDVKRGKGARGANITYTGEDPATGTATITLWRVPGITSDILTGIDDFAAWEAFMPLLKYDPTKATITALDIFYPSFPSIGLTSVVTEEIGIPEHKGKGRYEVTISFLEYFPPPPANATASPKGSATSATTPPGLGAPVPPAPLTAQELLQQLQQQAQQP